MSYFFQSILIFISVILSGISVFFIPKFNNTFKYSLIFSGSYLFAITILHILPELYSGYSVYIGICIIIGFLLQLILEYFSGGIEHGHIYDNDNCNPSNQITKTEKYLSKSAISLFLPLCLHAILDSIILISPEHNIGHHHHNNNMILLGIILHKLPAAFALVMILSSIIKKKTKIIIYLIIFALASPFGLLIGSFFINYISNGSFLCFRAIAGGSFLSISTTIFFESSPNHSFDKGKLLVTFLGILMAILMECLH